METIQEISDGTTQFLDMCPEMEGEVVLESTETECNEVCNEQQVHENSKDSLPKRCPCCDRVYSKTFNLRRHMVNVHGMYYIDLNNHKGHIKCAFTNCTACFSRIVFYRQHLFLVHGVKLEKITMNFNSINEFLTWKAAEERETQSRFNKFKRDANLKEGNIKKRSYICCRSGKSFVKGTKKKEYMKIGTYCPAKMEILYNNKKVVLTYFKTHVGHGSLHDVYVTSERARIQDTARRQRKQYENLKAEVKAKVEQFLENLALNKYSVDFLKTLSKKLSSFFNPDSNLENNQTETETKLSMFPNVTAKCYSESADTSTKLPSYNGYIAAETDQSKNKQLMSTRQRSSCRPVVVYTSKEKQINTPRIENNALNLNIENSAQLILQNQNKLEKKEPTRSHAVIFMKKLPSTVAVSEPNCGLKPVIMLKPDKGNVFMQHNTQLHSSTVSCDPDSSRLPEKSLPCVDVSKCSPTKSDKNVSLLKNNYSVINTVNATRDLGQVVSVKCDYSASLNTSESSLLKKHFDLVSGCKLQPVSEEKRKFLESLWNSYKNSPPPNRRKVL